MTKAIHPILKDRTHETSSEAISERLAEAMLFQGMTRPEEMEKEWVAKQKEIARKNYFVKGISPQHTEEIKRVDQAAPTRNLTWEERSAETQKNIKEKREAEKDRQAKLKKIKWEQEQPWDQKPETFDQKLDTWNRQTEELLKDFSENK